MSEQIKQDIDLIEILFYLKKMADEYQQNSEQ